MAPSGNCMMNLIECQPAASPSIQPPTSNSQPPHSFLTPPYGGRWRQRSCTYAGVGSNGWASCSDISLESFRRRLASELLRTPLSGSPPSDNTDRLKRGCVKSREALTARLVDVTLPRAEGSLAVALGPVITVYGLHLVEARPAIYDIDAGGSVARVHKVGSLPAPAKTTSSPSPGMIWSSPRPPSIVSLAPPLSR
jgi:hypothetical protein